MSPEARRAIVELRAAAFEALAVADVRDALPEARACDDDAITRALAVPDEASREPGDARVLAWGRSTASRLDDGLLPPRAVRPYLLRWLGAHLLRAEGDPAALRRLLTPAWRAACEAVFGDAAPLRDDLGRLEARCVELDAAGPSPPRWIGTRWFCALARASSRDAEARLHPAGLVADLVRAGVWSPRQGATAVLRKWQERRSADLAAVGPALGPAGARYLFERLCALDDEATGPLFALVEHLPSRQRASATSRAIARLRPRFVELQVLQSAVEAVDRLPRGEREAACDALLWLVERVDGQWRGEAMVRVAPLLDVDAARRCLRNVSRVAQWDRARAGAAIVKGREAALIAEGLAACASIEACDHERTVLLRAVAPGVSPALVPRVFALLTEGEGWQGAGRFAALDAIGSAGPPEALEAAIAYAEALAPLPDGFDLAPWRELLAQRRREPVRASDDGADPPAVDAPPAAAPGPAAPPPAAPDALRDRLRLGDDDASAAALVALAAAAGDAATRAAIAAPAWDAARTERHPVRRLRALAEVLGVATPSRRAEVVRDALATVGEALTAPDAALRARRPRSPSFSWDPPPVEPLEPPLRALLAHLDEGERLRLADLVNSKLAAHPSRLPATFALELTAPALAPQEIEAALAHPATWFDARGGLRALAALRHRVPAERLLEKLGAVRAGTPNRATTLRDLLLGRPAPTPRGRDVPDLRPRADPAEHPAPDGTRADVLDAMLTWRRDAAPELLLDLSRACQEVRALWP